MSSTARRGFTLIELLVVIAIIAVLIALLVPAVQKVREAAARTQCQNNLKQIAIAAHSYHDTYKKLPAGWVTSNSVQPSPGWSWAVVILPYLEQQALYNSLAPDVTTPGGAPAPSSSNRLDSPLPVYVCPSDAGGSVNTYLDNYGKNNYACNREVFGPDASNKPVKMTMVSIIDGTSNTIFVGEREMTKNTGAVWVRANATSASFEGRPGTGINKFQTGTPTTGDCRRLGFTSLHTGGCNFVLGDGSIRFVSDSISADQSADHCAFPAASGNFVLQNLTHPADGFPVGNF
jgi:prepilin-type N-terminal cleavage/methylation domain-containing protein